jgi:hypothetical protein
MQPVLRALIFRLVSDYIADRQDRRESSLPSPDDVAIDAVRLIADTIG